MSTTAADKLASPRFETGELVGEHRLLSRLGDARLSEIWLVENTETKQRLALRRFKPELESVPRAAARFVAESNVLSAITHVALPRVHGFVEHAGERWCTQELVTGRRLDTVLEAGTVPVPLALEGAAGLAAALAQLHAVGIAHRGVHPHNVFVAQKSGGRVMKLLGFGGARLPGPGIDEPPVPSSVAARYVSPEEASGKEPDTRSDVWALGKLLRALLPNGPELSIAIDELILSCLQDDPAERPRDLGAVAQVLVNALEESGVVYRSEETVSASPADVWSIPETSAKNPLSPSSFPRRFGSYHLLTSLGRGGMGDVCLARTIGPAGIQRVCVIKQIRVDHSGDDDYVRRFVDEARVMAELNHTNICHVLEVGYLNDTYYLAIEHIHGVSVSQLTASSKEGLPRPVALHLIAEILEGLDYAHRHRDPLSGTPRPVVHRDVSPHNVMVNFEGEVKLIDFGLAAREQSPDETGDDVVMGKLAYMAPEQARGDPVDRRADQYAAAIVATELLQGERFYGALPPHAIWALCSQGDYVPRGLEKLPAEVRAVLRRALSPQPKDRYDDCRAFKAALLDAAWGDAPLDGRAVMRGFMQATCADHMQRSFERIQAALKALPMGSEELELPDETPFTAAQPAAARVFDDESVLKRSPRRVALYALAAGVAALAALGIGGAIGLAFSGSGETAAAAVEEPRTIHISIVTDPPGATVLRGDQRVPAGITPVIIEVEASPEVSEEFVVEREGFQPTRFEARLDRDHELRAQLRPVPPPPPAVQQPAEVERPVSARESPAVKPKPKLKPKPARQKKIERNSVADPW